MLICTTILVLFCLQACGDNNTPKITDDDERKVLNTKEPTLTYQDDYEMTDFTDEEMQIYNELFDINSKISIDIDISKKQMALIQRDYEDYSAMGGKSQTYRMADKVTITINDKVYEIEEVGIRMKGNTSRNNFCASDGSKIYNLIHFRLSFDETFDDETVYGSDAKVWDDEEERKARKKRTFAALEKMEVKWNYCYDETYIREYYAHEMFNSFGVLAAKVNLASFDINNVHCGVYTIFEPVDDLFLEKNLPKEDLGGDLYKCAWTMVGATYTQNVTYGIEDGMTAYNYDLKTNKKTSEHYSLWNLLNVLNQSNLSKEDFESVVDVDRWISFAAVSYFTANPDDMRNNYNNHYLYFLKSSGKAIFIPYDYDRTLGVTAGWDPTGNGLTMASPYSQWAQGAQEYQVNPLYLNTVSRGGYYVNEYRAKLLEISESKWMDPLNYNDYFLIAKDNYSNLTIPSQSFDNVSNQDLRFADNIETRKYNVPISSFMKAIKNTVNDKIDDYIAN